MLCSDTDFEHQAIRLEHLNDMNTLQRLNDLVGALKSKVFRGNGKITLVYTGGNVPRFEFETVVQNDDKKLV